MKRLLAIATHPRMYYFFRRGLERMVLLHAACEMLHIKDPTVWDVDRVKDILNKILEAIHEDPHLLDGNKIVCEHLFWTIMLSRFKKLTISRETTKRILDEYNFTVEHIKKENITSFDVITTHVLMVKMFGNLI